MRKTLTTLCALGALAAAGSARAETGDMLLKVRASYNLRGASSAVLVPIANTPVKAKATDNVGAEAAISVFLTDTIAAEFMFGGAPYDLETNSGRQLSTAGVIQPAVTLQYHPAPIGRVRPYVGVGAAYVSFYSEKPGEALTSQSPVPQASTTTSLKGRLAPVGQIGMDIAINDKFYVNLDGKYVHASSQLTVSQLTGVHTVNHTMKSFSLALGVGVRF